VAAFGAALVRGPAVAQHALEVADDEVASQRLARCVEQPTTLIWGQAGRNSEGAEVDVAGEGEAD
jgi:hypothetical protein